MVAAPKVKFDDHTSYKDTYKGFKVESPVQPLGKGCVMENVDFPQRNFQNSNSHLYYDDKAHKFIWDKKDM